MLHSLLLVPLGGILITMCFNKGKTTYKNIKITGLVATMANLLISIVIFILFDNSSNQFQLVQEHTSISSFDIYLGIDGLSIYFVLLTTIMMPIALLSN